MSAPGGPNVIERTRAAGRVPALVETILGECNVQFAQHPGVFSVNCVATGHEDEHASAVIGKDLGAYQCKGCGARMTLLEFAVAVRWASDVPAAAKRAAHWLDGDAPPRKGPRVRKSRAVAPTKSETEWRGEAAAAVGRLDARADRDELLRERRLSPLGARHLGAGVRSRYSPHRKGDCDVVGIPVHSIDGKLCGFVDRFLSCAPDCSAEGKHDDGKGRVTTGLSFGLVGFRRAMSRYHTRVEEGKLAIIALMEGESDTCEAWSRVLTSQDSPLCPIGLVPGADAFEHLAKCAALFKDLVVATFADADDAGVRAGDKAAAALRDVAADLRIVDVPLTPEERASRGPDGKPDKKDVRHLLGAGGRTADALVAAWSATLPELRAGERAPPPVPEQVPPLAAEAFHGPAGAFVREIEPFTEADPAALLSGYLVLFGVVIGNAGDGKKRPYYEVRPGDRHYTNLFHVHVGRSGPMGAKGQAERAVLALFEAAVPGFGKHPVVMRSLATKEGVIHRIRDDRITKKYDKKSKTTIDGDVDPGEPDKRLAVVCSEFVSVVDVMNRDGNLISAFLREAWDCPTIVENATKTNFANVSNPHVGVLGSMPLVEARAKVVGADVRNGLWNRLAPQWSERSKRIDDDEVQPPADFYPRHAQRLATAIEFARDAGRMTQDVALKPVWRAMSEFLDCHVTNDDATTAGALLQRARPMIRRWSMVFALLDGSKVIRLAHLLAAAAFADRWIASVSYIFPDPALPRDVVRVYEVIRRAGRAGVNRTTLHRELGGHRQAGNLEDALQMLADRGLVAHAEVRGTGGRPGHSYRALAQVQRPSLLTLAKRAAAEAGLAVTARTCSGCGEPLVDATACTICAIRAEFRPEDAL